MTLTFKLKRTSTKSKRNHKKFPRQKFKSNYETTARNLKEWGYCKHNWNDDDGTAIDGNFIKFLKHHIGQPINKVYSKFLKRCHKLRMYNPMEEFYLDISKKENIDKRFGGFYVEDGILKYQDKQVIKDNSRVIMETYNKYTFEESNVTHKLKALIELKTPQCLGRFILSTGEKKTIYIDYYPHDYDIQRLMPYKYHNVACRIPFIGFGIDYDILNSQTGKTKLLWWLKPDEKPDIYFYYKK